MAASELLSLAPCRQLFPYFKKTSDKLIVCYLPAPNSSQIKVPSSVKKAELLAAKEPGIFSQELWGTKIKVKWE